MISLLYTDVDVVSNAGSVNVAVPVVLTLLFTLISTSALISYNTTFTIHFIDIAVVALVVVIIVFVWKKEM